MVRYGIASIGVAHRGNNLLESFPASLRFDSVAMLCNKLGHQQIVLGIRRNRAFCRGSCINPDQASVERLGLTRP